MLKRAEGQGFRAAALGAFVCRHSMDTSIASGRPDAKDEEIMLDFGRKAWEKVKSGDYELHTQPMTSSTDWEMGKQAAAYREEHPDEPYALPRDCKAKTMSDCWACINRCPKQAITSTSEQVKQIMASIGEAAKARLEPDIYF